jgi:hypothetical protein
MTVGWIEALFLPGPLWVVPLGLGLHERLAEGSSQAIFLWARRLALLFALGVPLSYATAPGRAAAVYALPWVALTALAGAGGLVRVAEGRWRGLEDLSLTASLLYLPVAGIWLAASRFGRGFMGFEEPIVLLTAVHFTFSGFAAPLMAGCLGRFRRGRPTGLYRVPAYGAVLGPPAIAFGFVFSPLFKVTAILLYTAALWTFAGLQWRAAGGMPRGRARIWLRISSAAVLPGMLLAAYYGLGEYLGLRWIDIPQMARWHGPINGLAFTLAGIIGWRFALREKELSSA